MKNIAIIGHEFHKKTLSTKFFCDMLTKYYDITFFWTHTREYKADITNFRINDITNLHAIILFQIFPDIQELELFNNKNVILIPMFDNDLKIDYSKWSKYHNYKFINFSKTLFEKLDFLDFKKNLYVQYMPSLDSIKPKILNKENNKPKIFFWQRSKEINWILIKKLIDFTQIESIHMHRISPIEEKDDWFEKPSENDIINYNISFSHWFDSKEDFFNKVNEFDIFIAPRLFEGIGLAFLEAMSLGKCIVAPNFPTMNEYIKDKQNGFLYDFTNPKRVDLNNWKEISHNAKYTASLIKDKWIKSENKIIEFIDLTDEKNISYNEYLDSLELSKVKNHFIIEDIKINNYLNINTINQSSMDFSKYLSLLISFFKKNINNDNKYIIYGAGTGCELITKLIDKKNILFIVDLDEQKYSTTINNISIYPIEKLLISDEKIIISLFGRYEKIYQFLTEKYKIKKDRIISLDFR
ncbi:glycosyltransferase [Arcobacter sp. KX21116]|uniref:glycosyltransferase n=1 Tax=Arcobacter iocasae TaxID=2906515 RepID=UPI0035D4D197